MSKYHIPVRPPEWILERIRNNLAYDKINGGLIWTVKNSNRVKIGAKAGSLSQEGYIRIGFRDKHLGVKSVAVHHIVWFLNTGEWPIRQIDHEDLDGTNNRFDNLRVATESQNSMNRNVGANNKLGIKNIYVDRQKYRVKVCEGDKIFSKRYDTLDEAIKKRDEIIPLYHGKFART